MGLLDLFRKEIECPECGHPAARKQGGQVRCPNSSCSHFDGEVAAQWQGKFGSDDIEVRYLNWQGKRRIFIADKKSIAAKRQHLSMIVRPGNVRIALKRAQIENLREVEPLAARAVPASEPYPSRVERQILGFHKRHGSTSLRYEALRQKYPNW